MDNDNGICLNTPIDGDKKKIFGERFILRVAWWYYDEVIFVTQEKNSIKKAKTLEKRPTIQMVHNYLSWSTINTQEVLDYY